MSKNEKFVEGKNKIIKDKIIKGKTKSGIKFTLDSRIKDDARLLFYMSRLRSNELTLLEQNDALFKLLETIFGSGEGLATFLNEVAVHHDGVADSQSLLTELDDMFEALKLKN